LTALIQPHAVRPENAAKFVGNPIFLYNQRRCKPKTKVAQIVAAKPKIVVLSIKLHRVSSFVTCFGFGRFHYQLIYQLF